MLIVASLIAWEADREKPRPYPVGNGDTLMVRIVGYGFCPKHCEANHHHIGHMEGYNCEEILCEHIIYEDRLN